MKSYILVLVVCAACGCVTTQPADVEPADRGFRVRYVNVLMEIGIESTRGDKATKLKTPRMRLGMTPERSYSLASAMRLEAD